MHVQQILIEALEPARAARLKILDLFTGIQDAPRAELRESAPRHGTIAVEKDLLGKLIGPQGTTIRGLEKTTGSRITVNGEECVAHIFAPNRNSFDMAMGKIMVCGGEMISFKNASSPNHISTLSRPGSVEQHTAQP